VPPSADNLQHWMMVSLRDDGLTEIVVLLREQ